MEIILLSVIAGICGTGLGGFITVVFGKSSDSSTCVFLSFAGGIMISISCFGLLPEAEDLGGIYASVGGLVIGIVVIMVLNRIVDYITLKSRDKRRIHSTPAEYYHEEELIGSKNKSSLVRSGIIMLIAIGIHNVPEGLAIGSGGSHDFSMGVLMAVMIAIHNVPEGMAIAAPLTAAKINGALVVLLTLLSGAPTVLGAALGLLLGNISDMAVALCLSGAAGAMLYVVFGEIIPQAVAYRKDRLATISTLVGIVLGLIIAKF